MGPEGDRDKKGDVPRSRGLLFLAYYHVSRELFGDAGMRSIGERLSPEARKTTLDEMPLPLSWYPSLHAVEWYEAALAARGAANGDVARFHTFLHRTTDFGFGRVRRTLLGLFGPEGLVDRASELWRHDHTTGDFTITARRAHGVDASLRDHPFVSTRVAQSAIVEIIRDILTRARGVKRVTETHAMEAPGTLHMRFDWQ